MKQKKPLAPWLPGRFGRMTREELDAESDRYDAEFSATRAKRIANGKLKPVTHKQMPALKKLLAQKGNARSATQGTYYIGSYQYSGRLWYDYRYSSFSSSSSYYGYYYYRNWKVCNSSYSYCLGAGSYDYYYYIYYYGTWYYGGWYGPYSG